MRPTRHALLAPSAATTRSGQSDAHAFETTGAHESRYVPHGTVRTIGSVTVE
jgi:hypothetical protein